MVITACLENGPTEKHDFREPHFPSALEFRIEREDMMDLRFCGRISIGNLMFHNPLTPYDDLCYEVQSGRAEQHIEDNKAGILCFNSGEEEIYFVLNGIETFRNPETGDYFNPKDDTPRVSEWIRKRRKNKERDTGKDEAGIPLRREDDPDIGYLMYVSDALNRNGPEYTSDIAERISHMMGKCTSISDFKDGMGYILMKRPPNTSTAIMSVMLVSHYEGAHGCQYRRHDNKAGKSGNADAGKDIFTEVMESFDWDAPKENHISFYQDVINSRLGIKR
ncbi:MAG: hypothetical protein R6U32_05235 [Candidatus Woesearchaeota archaeon]